MNDASDKLWEGIRQARWREPGFGSPDILASPSMMTDDERRMLAWISQNSGCIGGDICELGPFMGGSTVSLAWGVQHSDKLDRKIYSFDHFTRKAKTRESYLPPEVNDLCQDNSVLPVYRHYTKRYADIVVPIEGELQEQHWPASSEISVMLVDVAKSRATNDHVLIEFFSKMAVGGIVIQQDYLYHKAPWVIYSMFVMQDCFERLGWADENSVVFGVKRKIASSDYDAALSRNHALSSIVDPLGKVAATFPDTQRRVIMRAKRNVELFPDAMRSNDFRRPRV